MTGLRPAATGTRNGLPGPKPYVYGGDERDAEIAAKIAAVRARLTGPAEPLPVEAAASAEVERCDDCGYLVTAPGHQIICGDTP
jgi:hypothetical protein